MKVVSYTRDSLLVENLEELVEFSFQEITQPLNQLGPESPTDQAFPNSPPQSTLQVMAVVNQPAWRARMPLNLVAPLHDLPKKLKRVLPKFDPGKGFL